MGIKSILLAATALVLSTSVNAAVIEFDDVTTSATLQITDGYNGFNWGGIFVGGGTAGIDYASFKYTPTC